MGQGRPGERDVRQGGEDRQTEGGKGDQGKGGDARPAVRGDGARDEGPTGSLRAANGDRAVDLHPEVLFTGVYGLPAHQEHLLRGRDRQRRRTNVGERQGGDLRGQQPGERGELLTQNLILILYSF